MDHTVITAKLFKNGHSQAVRLPKQFRFEGDEVLMYRQGDRVIIQPKRTQWEDFFLHTPAVPADFLRDRSDTPPQKRDSWF